ncbi:MAG: class I SAM-dependent rRNA methyltransferase [Deltaproteobacteria bacterium]
MNVSLEKALEKSLRTREQLFQLSAKENTDCFRLLNGSTEGIPGVIAEQYSKVAILQWHEGKSSWDRAHLESIGAWYGKNLGVKSVYLKKFISDRSSQVADKNYYSASPIWGEISEPKIICHERGMQLEIHPYDGFSTGIFLDQRNNREFLQGLGAHQQVLNCFAYTCAFSLACALGGAQVTSVDVSKKYLDWGKRNFELNQVTLAHHPFYAVDVFEQFKKAKKLGKEYGLIILDPPSFSRNDRGGVFSVRKDLELLVEKAVEVLAPKGVLFFSCNLSTVNSGDVARTVQKVMQQMNKKANPIPLPKVPFDFEKSETVLSACCFRLG